MDADDPQLRAWQQALAEQTRLFERGLADLRQVVSPASHQPAPPPSSGSQSWNVVRTLITLGALLAFVLSVGRWWGLTDMARDKVTAIDNAMPTVHSELADHERRLKALEGHVANTQTQLP